MTFCEPASDRAPSSTSPCRTIPPACTCRARRPTSTTSASPRARCMSRSAWSNAACGRAGSSRPLGASRAAPGVVAVITAADIPGKNDIAPVFADEPLLVERDVIFHGQALFAVVARSRDEARRAARLGEDRDRGAPPAVTIADALNTGARVQDDYAFGRGDAKAAIAAAPHRLEGQLRDRRTGAFLPRGPGLARHPRRRRRDARLLLDASTRPRRSTSSRASSACPTPSSPSRRGAWAAASAARRARPAPGRRSRRSRRASPAARARSGSTATTICMLTGKRHDFRADYEVGFDDDGARRRRRRDAERALRLLGRPVAGASSTARCSTPTTRYWLPDVAIGSRRLKTNTVSNTAFRGFGGPQGMIAIERVMDDIAARAAASTRSTCARRNFYGAGRATSRPTARRSRINIAARDDRASSSRRSDYRARARDDRRLQRDEPGAQARARADAGEVRHLLHR